MQIKELNFSEGKIHPESIQRRTLCEALSLPGGSDFSLRYPIKTGFGEGPGVIDGGKLASDLICPMYPSIESLAALAPWD